MFVDPEDLREKVLQLEKRKSLNNYEILFRDIIGEICAVLASSETISMSEMTCFLQR